MGCSKVGDGCDSDGVCVSLDSGDMDIYETGNFIRAPFYNAFRTVLVR